MNFYQGKGEEEESRIDGAEGSINWSDGRFIVEIVFCVET